MCVMHARGVGSLSGERQAAGIMYIYVYIHIYIYIHIRIDR